MKNNEKNNSPAYSGALATPIVYGDPSLEAQILGEDDPVYEQELQVEAAKATKAMLAKLPLLLDHFEVSRSAPDKWMQLSYKLARAHVPGFQVNKTKKAGAPQDWGPLELASLHIEVERLAAEGMTAMDACRALVARPERAQRFPRSMAATTLYRRYQEAKTSIFVTAYAHLPAGDIKRALEDAIVEAVAEGSKAA